MQRLKELFVRNASLKVLSFFFAVSLWIFVNLKATAERVCQVPVRWQNIPSYLEITNAATDSIRVQVKGPQRILSNLDPMRIPVVLDLADAKVGLSNYQINEKMIPLPPGLSATVLLPDTIQFKFESIVEKEVPIQPHHAGDPGAGYSLDGIEVTPSRVKVLGAQSELQNLYRVDTEPIDVSGREKSFETRVRVALNRPHVWLAPNQETVLAKIQIVERIVKKTLPQARVVAEGPGGAAVSIQPPAVDITLEGPAAAIRSVVPGEVTARVVLPDVPAPVQTLRVFVQVPVAGIRAESAPDRVVVRVSPGVSP
ncbi:MAG: CdaR family protein [bacterium]